MPAAARERRLDPGDLPPARRADPGGLLLGRVLRLHQAAARGRRPPSARDDAGVPEAGFGARRDRRGDRGPEDRARAREPDGDWVPGWDQLEVHALHEGDRDRPARDRDDDRGRLQPVRAPRDGLPRRARAALAGHAQRRRGRARPPRGKQIFYFPARHDHWLVQTGDGWSAHVAGAIGVSTDAQASWWGGRGIGTVPHGLIAAYGGDTVKAARVFAERFHDEMNITVLVDFENDSVSTALEVAEALGPELWGVRLDTSETLVDRSLLARDGRLQPDRRQPAAGREGARGARRRRLRRRADRRSAAASPPSGSASSRPRASRSTPTGSARR